MQKKNTETEINSKYTNICVRQDKKIAQNK